MSEIKIYADTSQVRVMEVKNLLDREGIAYHEVNKMDSSYAGTFGEIQIYVSEKDAENVRQLIENIKK